MRTLMLIAAAVLFLGEFPAVSRAGDQDRARELSNAGTIVPLEQITAQVRKRNIEQILEVELESDDQRYYYKVEVVDDAGIVRKLRYDAATGELIDETVDDD